MNIAISVKSMRLKPRVDRALFEIWSSLIRLYIKIFSNSSSRKSTPPQYRALERANPLQQQVVKPKGHALQRLLNFRLC